MGGLSQTWGTKTPGENRKGIIRFQPSLVPPASFSAPMSTYETGEKSPGSSAVVSVLEIVSRLGAALRLVGLAEEAIPQIASSGHTSKDVADEVLRQIPSLRADIAQQIEAAKAMLSSIQDRVEAVAQFLMLHRKVLSREQSHDLDRWMSELRSA